MEPTTAKAKETRERLLRTACAAFAEQGFAATTMRDIAARAGTSVGLTYRYFPTKSALVIALYEELAAAFVDRVALPDDGVVARYAAAIDAAFEVLGPHRGTLGALLGTLPASAEDGLFVPHLASQAAVRDVYRRVVVEARHAPAEAEALGDLLYVGQLGLLVFWLVDRTPGAVATAELRRWTLGIAPTLLAVWRVPPTRTPLRALIDVVRRAILEVPS